MLHDFNLSELIRKFNLGERNICQDYVNTEEQLYYDDFQILTYLARYAVYNETISELFHRCTTFIDQHNVVSRKIAAMGKQQRKNSRIFQLLLQNKIIFSGHRLLAYSYGNTEACLTVSFSTFTTAIQHLLKFIDEQLSCGIEIIDPAVKRVPFEVLENLSSTYQPKRHEIKLSSSMKYRFNLIVNIASVDVLDILEAMLPSSRKTAVENLATIAIVDEFFKAVRDNTVWKLFTLTSRISTSKDYLDLVESERPVKTIAARDLFQKITKSLLSVGKPSIIFLDSLNEKLHEILPFFKLDGRSISTTNLCCEIALPTLPDEIATCNIAAVNLKGVCDFWEAYNRAYALTNVMNATIHLSTYAYTRSFRPLGIGTIGAFDCFTNILKQINPTTKSYYTQLEALDLMDDLFCAVYLGCVHASSDKARVYGSFENFIEIDYKQYPKLVALAKRAAEFGLLDMYEASFKHRYNLTLTAQAPTASMSLFTKSSPSLEPCEHDYFLRVHGTFIKVQTEKCGLELWQKSKISEQLIKRFSKYCEQTISASAYIFEPTSLAKLIMKRREYCGTGMYYCRNIQTYDNILCNSCSM